MRRSLIVIVASCAVILLFAGGVLAAQVVRVGAKANGKTVVLRAGDTLVVSLAGNATTGYFWRVLAVDRSVVRFFGRTYVPRRSDPGTVGGGGTYVLRFRAVATGETPLKLGYVQAGRASASPAKRFAVVVAVKR